MNTTRPLNQRRDAARATAINIIRIKQFPALNGVLVLLVLLCCLTSWGGGNTCLPGWSGQLLVPAPTAGLPGWSVKSDGKAFGSLITAVDSSGTNIQFNWNIGVDGDWVEACYEFSPPIDLSAADILGVTLRGDSNVPANVVGIMFEDTSGVRLHYDLPGQTNGINQVTRWLPELPIPKKAFNDFSGRDITSGNTPALDWSNIQKLFVVVKREQFPSFQGDCGSGRLWIGRLQYDQAASWPRQRAFATIPNRAEIQLASSKAIQYLLTAQQPNGLLTSWREEYPPTAVLYDQALALIALTREGVWVSPHSGSWGRSVALTREGVLANGAPANACALASRKLAQFLVTSQKSDGHWARKWNPSTGAELQDDRWVGDQAWCVMALTEYALRSGNVSARTAAAKGAQWLAGFIEPSGAIQGYPSTEGTVDVWWAMISTLRFSDAEKIKSYLLNSTNVWDADLQYWWSDAKSQLAPSVTMDCATWLSAFARHPLVAHPERGLAALSFVRRTLLTTSDDGSLCGFDAVGPVSISNEGTAQYVASGGKDASVFLETLLVQQNPDGSMPSSPDNWSTDAFHSWLSKMSGVAPTAWLYFATKGLPFPQSQSQLRW